MKSTCSVLLSVMLSTSLFAQTGTNPPPAAAPAAQETPAPPVPLSNATRGKITKMTSLFDGKTLNGWVCFTNNAWVVKDGVMASTGAGRGVIYTQGEYGNYRLIFNVRHVSGQP